MEWYYFVIIGVALAFIGFVVFYLISLKKHKTANKEAEQYYSKIIDAVGGLDNIVDISCNGSRLTIVLNDYENTNQESLNQLVSDGVGIVKYNKKLTMVVGELASLYYNSILKELKK